MYKELRETMTRFRWQEHWAPNRQESFDDALPYVKGECYDYADDILSIFEHTVKEIISKLTVLSDEEADAILERGFDTDMKPTSLEHAHRMFQLAHTIKEIMD